ncbi:Curved DNA-binding protein [compost metagenome]
MEFKDYYQTLGVSPTATADEIKKAYRKLARKYHPDVSKEPDAVARMTAVNEANAVLSDPEKRAAYDRLAQEPRMQPGQDFRPPPHWDAGFEFSDGAGTHGGPGGAPGDYSDFFEQLFGRAARARGAGRSEHTSGRPPPPSAAQTTTPASSWTWPTPTRAPNAPSRCKARTRPMTDRWCATSATWPSRSRRACAKASSSAWLARAAQAGVAHRRAICFWRCCSSPTRAGAPRAAMSTSR